MDQPSSQTVKISFRWLFVSLVLIFALGAVGGFVGQRLGRQTSPLPSTNGEQFVTNVQQVTVTPNKNMTQIVDTLQRSLFLLGTTTPTSSTISAVGISLTSDGLLATTVPLEGSSFIAIDQTGVPQVVSKVGTDEVYGLTYFRLQNAVAVPVDIATQEAAVGSQLLSVSRSATSASAQVEPFTNSSFVVSPAGVSPALQRLMVSEKPFVLSLPGTPGVGDDGKIVGILLPGKEGLFMRSSDIKESLDRIIAQKREENPFATLGLTARYEFVPATTVGQTKFAVTVTGVTNGSPAAIAGIKPQDSITRIGDQPVSWQKNIITQLTAALPLQLTVSRAGQERTVTLTAVSTP